MCKRLILMPAKKKPADRREITAIRLTPPVKAAVEKAALADRRSMSSYIEGLVLEDLKKRGLIK
jgi:hypothetical protein